MRKLVDGAHRVHQQPEIVVFFNLRRVQAKFEREAMTRGRNRLDAAPACARWSRARWVCRCMMSR